MTKAEAEIQRVKWKQQVDAPTCEHLNQELETNEMGYLTGTYHCVDCGEPVSKHL